MNGDLSDRDRAQHGSILLATMLVCVGCAALVLCLSSLISTGLRVALTETAAQSARADAEAFLEAVRLAAIARWEPRAVMGEDGASGSLGYRADVDLQDPVASVYLQATVSLPAAVYEGKSVGARRLSALVERAWDGVELPHAAIVARSVVPAVDRTTPGISSALPEEAEAVPVATQFRPVESLGAFSWTHLTSHWELDAGTKTWLEEGQVGLAPSVTLAEERTGVLVRPDLSSGGSGRAESPLLLVALGGVVDARNLGEVWGVLVGAENVLLEGTTLHGAVYCTGELQLGHTGYVIYEESVRLWAMDHSLYRVRLVPGTRVEEWVEEAP